MSFSEPVGPNQICLAAKYLEKDIPDGLTVEEIIADIFNGMRANICNLIESIGLPHKQERAIITSLKWRTYQDQAIITKVLCELNVDEDRRFYIMDRKLAEVVKRRANS